VKASLIRLWTNALPHCRSRPCEIHILLLVLLQVLQNFWLARSGSILQHGGTDRAAVVNRPAEHVDTGEMDGGKEHLLNKRAALASGQQTGSNA
jgi:hypothetical protein